MSFDWMFLNCVVYCGDHTFCKKRAHPCPWNAPVAVFLQLRRDLEKGITWKW